MAQVPRDHCHLLQSCAEECLVFDFQFPMKISSSVCISSTGVFEGISRGGHDGGLVLLGLPTLFLLSVSFFTLFLHKHSGQEVLSRGDAVQILAQNLKKLLTNYQAFLPAVSDYFIYLFILCYIDPRMFAV